MPTDTDNNEVTPSKASRRHPLGRRKSDWIIPLILFTMALMAGLWAIDSYSKAQQMQEINTALSVQSQLLDRLLEKGDADRAKTPPPAPPPVSIVTNPPALESVTPAPTFDTTPLATVLPPPPAAITPVAP